MKKCTVPKPGNSDFPSLNGVLVGTIAVCLCGPNRLDTTPPQPLRDPCSFEELVLSRQKELSGPQQHCIIAIIVSRDYKNRLGSIEQL